MMDWKAPLVVSLAVVIAVSFVAATLSATSAAPPSVHPNLPPPPTAEKPTPQPKPTGGGGGGGNTEHKFGGSRFPHCNSTVEGFVTNYSAMAPGSGVLVEIGGGGWKNQIPADDNGYFAFKGLCPGTGYVRVVVPPGSLLTNPNAEVALDGKNQVRVDQGFFLPVLQAASGGSWAQPSPAPVVTSAASLQLAPAVPQPSSSAVTLLPGMAISLVAPRTVRVGMDAQVNISIQNGGPGQVASVVVHLPLAAGIRLQEADTSRGALKMEQIPQALSKAAEGKVAGVAAPAYAAASKLVVEIGALPPGEVVLIATKVRFRETVLPGGQAQMQAQVWSDGAVYRSNTVVITLEETGSPFQITLPTTGEDGYLRRFHELLW